MTLGVHLLYLRKTAHCGTWDREGGSGMWESFLAFLLLPQEWEDLKKWTTGCFCPNLWVKSILCPQASLPILCCLQARLLALVLCQLIKQELHLAQATHDNTGSFWGCCYLLAHYLKTPICRSQFEAVEKLALHWYFMWNNYWNKQLQWHTAVGWR